MSNAVSPAGWIKSSRREPCVVCDHASWCTRSADGTVVRCMRIESDCPVVKGGWIHRLSEPLPPRQPKPVEKLKDITAIADAMYNHPLAEAKRHKLAIDLGVSYDSLDLMRVGIGWDAEGRKNEFASWPSRDASGAVVGITRRYPDGGKFTLKGTSNSGVFVPAYWWLIDGPIYIVEGGSDVAALLTHDRCGIGRPSNTGGSEIIAMMIARRAKGREVVIVAENDFKPERRGTESCKADCKGCMWCFPGLYGAMKVSNELARLLKHSIPWKLVPIRHKDMRAWSHDTSFISELKEWSS